MYTGLKACIVNDKSLLNDVVQILESALESGFAAMARRVLWGFGLQCLAKPQLRMQLLEAMLHDV